MTKALFVNANDAAIHAVTQAANNDIAIARVSSLKELFFNLESIKPDLMLLDDDQLDGCAFETAAEINANPLFQGMTIAIMATANEPAVARAQARDSGAVCFINKPCPEEAIQAILDGLIERIHLSKSLSQANDMTASLIQNNSTTGDILHLVRRSCSLYSIESLTDLLLESAAQHKLQAVIEYRSSNNTRHYTSPNVEVTDIDKHLLEKGAEQASVFNQKQYSVFTRDNLSLLIKNMPTDQAELYGQFKDNFALLIDCFSSRFSDVELQEASRSLQQEMCSGVQTARSTLMDVQTTRYRQILDMGDSIENLLDNLKRMFSDLILTEWQENQLQGLAEEAVKSAVDIQSESLNTDVEMERALSYLNTIAETQLPNTDKNEAIEADTDEASIELF